MRAMLTPAADPHGFEPGSMARIKLGKSGKAFFHGTLCYAKFINVTVDVGSSSHLG